MTVNNINPDVSPSDTKTIHILGTRGIPAKHGGFESCVARLAPYLREKGWTVFVYCQEEGDGPITTDEWFGVVRVLVPVNGTGTFSTIKFDWKALLYALKRDGLLLSFGYPTGAFALFPWIKRRKHIINMDGIEWKRSQFGSIGKAAYYINERFACYFGTHLIADHPCIEDHLATRVSRSKITTIAYGAENKNALDDAPLDFDLAFRSYGLVIARPERDNSILEIVSAFSEKRRTVNLVVLGNYNRKHDYHREVLDAASDQVLFPGAVYELERVFKLRSCAAYYVHGHKVGGTNPSLVEALGAASPTIAHDNEFNRWVAGDAAIYFDSHAELSEAMELLASDVSKQDSLSAAATKRWEAEFQWKKILAEYDHLLTRFI